MGQLSFASLTPKNKSTLRIENFLEQMKTVDGAYGIIFCLFDSYTANYI